VAVAMIAWSAISASAVGVEAWRFVLAVLVTGFVCWGLGGAVQLWLRLDAGERRAPIPRLALGFAAVTALIPLMAELRIGVAAIALILGIVGVSSNLLLYLRRSGPPRIGLHDATDWMIVAVIVRVCTAGSQFVVVGPTTMRLTQNWDLTYHLAQVKEALFRGLPVAQNPLLAGVPRPAYHPAFTDYAAVLIKGLGLPVDAGLYAVVLPFLGVAFVCGLMALTNYAVGSRRAHFFTLLVLAGYTIGAYLLVSRLGAYLPVAVLKHYLGLYGIAYFAYNPPGATAAVAAAMSVALFARGFARADRRALVVAAILAGASVAMKANTAMALGPALVTAAAFLAWRRRDIWLLVIPSVTALLAAVVWYLPTRGRSAQMAVDLGAYARYERGATSNSLERMAARLTDGGGRLGDALFLVASVAIVGVAWRAIPAVFALLRRPRLRLAEHESLASGANAYLIALIVWAIIVGFTIVQVDVGRFSAWNISGHTLTNVTWVGVVLAGIGLYRIASRLLGPAPSSRLTVIGLALLLAATPLAMRGVETIRQVGTSEIPTALYELLRRVPDHAPADAVVAQNFETEYDAWVAGIAGRGAVLERAETQRAYYPVEARERSALLVTLYSAPTPTAALDAARVLGVRYAIVGPNNPRALLEAGVEQVKVGDWVLVRFP
jgi:hypothetical protein